MSTDTIPFCYYNKTLPEAGDHVLGRVIDYDDNGIRLRLLEYKGHDCLINYRDACKSARIYKIHNQIKKGREYTFFVRNVDTTTGYLELIRRDLNEEDDKKYLASLEPYRVVLGLINSFFISQNIKDPVTQSTILSQTVWKYEPGECFKLLEDIYLGEKLIHDAFPELDKTLASELESLIKERYGSCDRVNGTVYFKLMSYDIDGIDKLRLFLQTLETQIGQSIYLKSPPDYYFTITGISKREKEKQENETKKIFEDISPNSGVTVRFEKIEWH